MIDFMRQGHSQGEALQQALSRTEVAWCLPPSLPAAEDPKKPSPDDPIGGRRPRKERTLKTLPNGKCRASASMTREVARQRRLAQKSVPTFVTLSPL